jgi:hypothetical protein
MSTNPIQQVDYNATDYCLAETGGSTTSLTDTPMDPNLAGYISDFNWILQGNLGGGLSAQDPNTMQFNASILAKYLAPGSTFLTDLSKSTNPNAIALYKDLTVTTTIFGNNMTIAQIFQSPNAAEYIPSLISQPNPSGGTSPWNQLLNDLDNCQQNCPYTSLTGSALASLDKQVNDDNSNSGFKNAVNNFYNTAADPAGQYFGEGIEAELNGINSALSANPTDSSSFLFNAIMTTKYGDVGDTLAGLLAGGSGKIYDAANPADKDTLFYALCTADGNQGQTDLMTSVMDAIGYFTHLPSA